MEGLPRCATECLLQAGSASSCELTDMQCICKDTQLQTLLQGCILQSCSVKEAFTAKRLSDMTCGVTPEAQTDTLVIVSTIFLVIAIICVLLRAAGRLMGSSLGMDDLAIALGLGVAIAIGVIAFRIRDLGLGQDIWMISFGNIDKILELFNVLTTIYPPCISLIKMSMLFLYLRLFPGNKIRLVTIITLVLTTVWGIIYTIVGTFVCTPRSYAWTSWDGEHQGTCLNETAIVVSHAIINIILDVFVIGLPIPTLLKLKLSNTKKAGVCMMFLIGLLVTVLSILRLSTTTGFMKSSNPTRDFVPVSIWSVLEIDLGIICACLPGTRAFLKMVLPPSESTMTYRSYRPSGESPSTDKTPKSFNLSAMIRQVSFGKGYDVP
ncbi:CFEM domain-containing protein [Aspergillus undulatus]|uniref:CFEM domain-containing protein n=1 Tax=Aspergillus undulatus TaxID=1810928 RepID=UPI003CCD2B23